MTTVVTRRPRLVKRRHATVLDDLDAARARARRVGIGEAGRVDVAVARDPRRADHAVHLDQREELARLLRRDEVDVEAESLGHRRRALELLPARLRGGEAQAARAVPSGGLAGLGFELARTARPSSA